MDSVSANERGTKSSNSKIWSKFELHHHRVDHVKPPYHPHTNAHHLELDDKGVGVQGDARWGFPGSPQLRVPPGTRDVVSVDEFQVTVLH